MSSWLSSLGDTIKNSAEDLTRGVQGKETGRAESVVVTFEGSALGLTVSDHGGEGVLSALAPGGEAERLGLKLGDRVVAVGGAPTFKYPDVVDAIRSRPDRPLQLNLERRSASEGQPGLVTLRLDEECAKDRALDPRRFLASRLRKRVSLVNSLLSRCISSPDFRAFVTEDDEDVPPEEPPEAPQRDVAWLVPLLPDPRIAALCGAVLCGVVSRAYGVPNGLVVAIFAAGAVTGLACAGVVSVQRVEKVNEDGGTCTLPRWPRVGGHCWSEPRAALFRVRGPTYLADRIKEPSDSALCRLIGVDLFATDTPESNLCRRKESFAQRVGSDAPPLIIALNFCLPWGNFALYWAAPDERNDVLQQFLDSDDDAYRDARLKLIPRVVEGNWLVRRAVGPGSKAAKLAETIELQYSRGAGYVEVSADLCGSATARRILSVVRSGTSGLVLDLALVVEGTTEAELSPVVRVSCGALSVSSSGSCSSDSRAAGSGLGVRVWVSV